MFVDFIRPENEFLDWYHSAAHEEQTLAELVMDYSQEYFRDFRFEPHTVADYFIPKVPESETAPGKTVYFDPPEDFVLFQSILESYRYKVEPLRESVTAMVKLKEHTLIVRPECVEEKSVILHELIHIYEDVFSYFPRFFGESLLLSLYKDLGGKIPDLDKRIVAHTNLYAGMDITGEGGEHGILFFLKSLALDLECGFKLGTVCGYGRDEQ